LAGSVGRQPGLVVPFGGRVAASSSHPAALTALRGSRLQVADPGL